MVPRTFPSTYQTANGETRMVVFFLSSVSGLTKWVDYIPVKFTMLETQVNNSYNNNGVILVDPLSSTTNKQAWVDYVPVFVDANDTAAWRVDANGFIPVGFSTKPTLNLDFAGTKTLDSRVTFTRASNATLFDGSGNLVYAPHNLLTYSEDFANVAWVKNNGATVANNTTAAPNGTITADTFTTGALASSGVFRFPTTAANTTHTLSVYLKNSSGSTDIRFGCDANPTNACIRFNPTTGVITSSEANVTASNVFNAGNNWYRISVSFVTTSTAPGIILYGMTGTVVSFHAWGAQLNVNPMQGGVTSSLSTYYPTVASAYYGPRFDHNPTTLQSLGLLIEEQRTNLLLQSEDFATTWTTSNSSITTNSTTAPNALTTADTLVENTANAEHYVQQQYTFGTNLAFSFSVYVKAAGRTNVRLFALGDRFGSTAQAFRFNLNTVAATNINGTSTGSIVDVGNGWYRCIINLPTTTTTGVLTLRIVLQDGANSSYTGDGTSGLFLWGAQLEAGAFATSYIPTTASAATRDADVATMTGTNFSSWYNATEGTFYGDGLPQASTVAAYALADISDGSVDNRISLIKVITSGNAGFTVVVSGSGQVFLDNGNWAATGKLIGAYKVNDFASSFNGSAAITDTIGTIPIPTQLTIGRRGDGGAYFNATIRRIAYYPVRLSNDQLQALTR